MKPFFYQVLLIGFWVSLAFLSFSPSYALPPSSSSTEESSSEKPETTTSQIKPQLTLLIIDGETGVPISAQVRVIDMLKKKFLYSGLLKDTLKVDLEPGGDYRIISKAQNHLFNEEEFNLADGKNHHSVKITLPLSPIKKGAKLQLKEVFFAVNSAEVEEESFAELKEVYDLLWEHPDLIIEISAHTDSQGSHDHNLELSERRAEAVVEFLKGKGVPARMLVAKGYGETKPLVANSSPQNMQKNRRVEFLVLDKK